MINISNSLDANYNPKPRLEDIYADEDSYVIERLQRLIASGEITKKDAGILLGILLRRSYSNYIFFSFRKLISSKAKSINTVFISSEFKKEEYVG